MTPISLQGLLDNGEAMIRDKTAAITMNEAEMSASSPFHWNPTFR